MKFEEISSEVFELLVKQHPNYGNLIVLDNGEWTLAQKTMSQNKSYTIKNRITTKAILVKAFRKFRSTLSDR